MTPHFQQIVTLESLRQRRTAAEFVHWVDGAFDTFAATKGARDWARLAGGPMVRLKDEAWPFAQLLRALPAFAAHVVSLPAGQGAADAVIFSPDGATVCAELQIVMAVNGYEERLRKELMSATGRAPAFGPISRDPKTKSVTADGRAVDATEPPGRAAALVTAAIEKKLAKLYPSGMWLLVCVDDTAIVDGYMQPVIDAAKAAYRPGKFASGFLVGTSKSKGTFARL